MRWMVAADTGSGCVQPLHARGARGAAAQEGAGEAGGGRCGRAHPRCGRHRRRNGRRRCAVRGAAAGAPRRARGPLPGPPRAGRNLPCRHRGILTGPSGRLGVSSCTPPSQFVHVVMACLENMQPRLNPPGVLPSVPHEAVRQILYPSSDMQAAMI